MSTNDQQFDETDEKSTLDETREKEDTTDNFDDLFADDTSDDDEAPVSREEYNRLLKGTKKLATELGRIKNAPKQEVKKEEAEVKPTGKDNSQVNPVLLNLYFKSNPEVKEVWEEVQNEAKLLGKDPFELYESSSYFKGEAKSRFNERSEREANKEKLTKPTHGSSSRSTFDPSKVKAEDVVNLKPSEKMAWIKAQAAKERDDE